jgi:hypothetical protein
MVVGMNLWHWKGEIILATQQRNRQEHDKETKKFDNFVSDNLCHYVALGFSA